MADETVKSPEEMSLEELKAAAAAEEVAQEAKDAESKADIELPESEAEEVPEQFVYKKEIDLGDGSGIQVFTGRGPTKDEAFEDFAEKMAEAQRNATIKIRSLNQKIKAEDTRTAQQKTDDEYVIAQRLQKEPSRAIRDVVKEVIEERESASARSLAAQQNFVDSHPDYVADADNGRRIMSEVQRLGFSEFTDQSLEKAYQSLKASGLLKLKTEEASEPTEVKAEATQRIAEPKVEATQVRSPKKSSTVSTRGAGAPVVKTGISEDELYSMPLDKLKKVANEQLARAGQD